MKLSKFTIVIFLGFIIYTQSSRIEANASSCPNGQQLVTNVVDGDTVDIENLGRIRVLGVDTYDKNKRMASKQSIRTGMSINQVNRKAYLATKFAKKLLQGKCVELETDYKEYGYYGRYLRYIKVDDYDYGLIAIKKGFGNVYCGDKRVKRYKQYQAASKFKCNY